MQSKNTQWNFVGGLGTPETPEPNGDFPFG
jgi:hypothetical protein